MFIQHDIYFDHTVFHPIEHSAKRPANQLWKSFGSIFSSVCRGGFRGGGGARGPRPPLSSGSGIFWDDVLEWYMNLYEPTDSRRRNAHKNISFAQLLPAFPEIWGTQISKFSRGSMPPDLPSLHERSHVCYKPPLQNAHCSPCVSQECSMWCQTYIGWMMNFPFEISIFVIYSLRLNCYTC